jgi:hypothetical protein
MQDISSSNYGRIEKMDNGKIYGFVAVEEMSYEFEQEVLNDYINMGFIIIKNEYKLSGGDINYMVYNYYDSLTKTQTSEEIERIEHGVFIMKTELKEYVSSKNKQSRKPN